MRVIKYNRNKHFEMLLDALKARGAYQPTKSEMPKEGYVVLLRGELVAAAFLRKVEGGYGQIDGLTSNPAFAPALRNEAIDLAATATINRAKSLGIKGLLFTSVDENTIVRSQKYGFKKSPLSVLAVDFTKRGI